MLKKWQIFAMLTLNLQSAPKMKNKTPSAGSDSAGMLHDKLATCGEKRPKTKAEMMRKTRANRKKEGLVELRLWLTPAQKERVLKYVAKFKRDA